MRKLALLIVAFTTLLCCKVAVAQIGIGACCFEEGCQQLPENYCVKLGGDWQGEGSTCEVCGGNGDLGACCDQGQCF